MTTKGPSNKKSEPHAINPDNGNEAVGALETPGSQDDVALAPSWRDNPDLARPAGLSPEGNTAYQIIMDWGESKGGIYTGGCSTFVSPARWRERGELYGENAELIIVHDGGDLSTYTGLPWVRETEAAFNAAGLYLESLTGWADAVHLIHDRVHLIHDRKDVLAPPPTRNERCATEAILEIREGILRAQNGERDVQTAFDNALTTMQNIKDPGLRKAIEGLITQLNHS